MVKNLGAWAIGLGVSAAALVAVFWGIRLGDLRASLQTAHYVYLLPAGAMLVLGLMARARSWHALLGGGVPYWRTFDALNEGYLLNNVLPLRLGEVGRAYLVSRGRDLTGSRALSSVLIERAIDLSLSVSILLVSLPFALAAEWAAPAARASVILVLGMYAGFFFVLRRRDWVLWIANRGLDLLPARLVGRWRLRAEAFMDGLEMLRDGQRLFTALMWSGAAWVTYALQIWFVLSAFFPAPPPAVVGFLLGVTAIGAAVPSSPGAVGVYEASAVAALLAFDYPRADALSFAAVMHLWTLTLTCLFGALGLAREGESLLSLANSARAYFRGAPGPAPALD